MRLHRLNRGMTMKRQLLTLLFELFATLEVVQRLHCGLILCSQPTSARLLEKG